MNDEAKASGPGARPQRQHVLIGCWPASGDATAGACLIRAEVADSLGNPDELQPIVHCAILLDSWDDDWDVSLETLNLLRNRRTD
ncbi:hypothetical protein [Streptomyces sp. NPDC059460]|uniref:hypothetical protein n=1 Tax=Streptomyces sp. NPDC059460 TaxID=3346840 RepID=UPI0036789ADB